MLSKFAPNRLITICPSFANFTLGAQFLPLLRDLRSSYRNRLLLVNSRFASLRRTFALSPAERPAKRDRRNETSATIGKETGKQTGKAPLANITALRKLTGALLACPELGRIFMHQLWLRFTSHPVVRPIVRRSALHRMRLHRGRQPH